MTEPSWLTELRGNASASPNAPVNGKYQNGKARIAHGMEMHDAAMKQAPVRQPTPQTRPITLNLQPGQFTGKHARGMQGGYSKGKHTSGYNPVEDIKTSMGQRVQSPYGPVPGTPSSMPSTGKHAKPQYGNPYNGGGKHAKQTRQSKKWAQQNLGPGSASGKTGPGRGNKVRKLGFKPSKHAGTLAKTLEAMTK